MRTGVLWHPQDGSCVFRVLLYFASYASFSCFRRNMTGIATKLKSAGYKTHMVGKVCSSGHLGCRADGVRHDLIL